MKARRPQHKTVLETYVYYHTQTPGYQVRFVKRRNGELVYDDSKYFGESRHGSLTRAARAARQWKANRVRSHTANLNSNKRWAS